MSFPSFTILCTLSEVFILEVRFMRPVLVAKDSWSLRKLIHWEGALFSFTKFIYGRKKHVYFNVKKHTRLSGHGIESGGIL